MLSREEQQQVLKLAKNMAVARERYRRMERAGEMSEKQRREAEKAAEDRLSECLKEVG